MSARVEIRSPIEVDVSNPCEHRCFQIAMGSQAVWHIEGLEPVLTAPNDYWVFHRFETPDGEICCDCFADDDEEVDV
jgi:hypothetical protein